MNPTSKDASYTASLASSHDTSTCGDLSEPQSTTSTTSTDAVSTAHSASNHPELIESLSALIDSGKSIDLPEEDLRRLEEILARFKWMKLRKSNPRRAQVTHHHFPFWWSFTYLTYLYSP